MKRAPFLLLCAAAIAPLDGSTRAAPSPYSSQAPLVAEVGECMRNSVSVGLYNQDQIFGQDSQQGTYRAFELQDRIDGLNGEFEEQKKSLQQRNQELQKVYKKSQENPGNMELAADMMKLQSALEIDTKLLQQLFQTRLSEVQTKFMEEVAQTVQEVAEEHNLDVIIPVDHKVSFVSAKADVTKKLLDRLNDKHRAKKRRKQLTLQDNKKPTK